MLTIDARWVHQTGIGTYLRHIIPGLLEEFAGTRMCLLGDRKALESYGWLDRGNLQFVPVASRMYSLAEQWEIARSIPRETEVLFSPHYNIPLLYRGKLLVTVYDLCHLALPDAHGSMLKTAYARYFFNAVRRRADAVITISDFTREELIRLTSRSDQPVISIPLGVDRGWFEAASYCNPGGDPYLLYVGNVKPHKNLGRLAEAFKLISPNIPHRLIIVGRKEGLITVDTSVQKIAATMGKRIAFTGHVDDRTLKQWVANAAVLVLPSLYEGFGLPPLEAMAAGCPVAVSQIPVLQEVCGDAAVYFDPYQAGDIARALTRVLGDQTLRDRLCRDGAARARQFTWDDCIARTCAVLRERMGVGR